MAGSHKDYLENKLSFGRKKIQGVTKNVDLWHELLIFNATSTFIL